MEVGTRWLRIPVLFRDVPRFFRYYSEKPPQEPQIPEYAVNPSESLSVKKARLVYQSRKRGMLENDLILSTFADRYLSEMNKNQIAQYDKLINKPLNDWDIYYWATGAKVTPPEFDNEVMNLLKEHVQNTNKQKRCRQPDLKPLEKT